MHDPGIRAEVLRRVRAGEKHGAIAGALLLPRSTVRDMASAAARPTCARCWRPSRNIRFTPGEYSELFGLYLGDGHITSTARTQRLRISLDAKHPGIIDQVERLLRGCFVGNRVSTCSLDGGATIVTSVYSTHLACLFPQTGAGLKHERALTFESWQYELIDAAPWSLLRGLVLSDGCAFINRTGRYRYLSYEFCNRSSDIRNLFTRACDLVGVSYRVNGQRIRIYQRAAVREFAAYVGAKR